MFKVMVFLLTLDIFHTFSSASVVDFEQIIFSQEMPLQNF